MRDTDRARLAGEFQNGSEFVRTSSSLYAKLYAHIAGQREIINLYDTLPSEKHHAALLMAAVRYLTVSHPDEALSTIYAAPDARDAMETVETAFSEFCDDYEYDIVRLMRNRSIQSNEPNRCAALVPALMKIQREAHRTIALVEPGASVGLNLLFDRFRYDYTGGIALGLPGSSVRVNCELRENPPKLDAGFPRIDKRIGIDIESVRFGSEEDEQWLRACINVGDVGAEQRFDSAWHLAKREWPDVREGDAAEKLERVVRETYDTDELVIYNSFMMVWMSEEERDDYIKTVREISNYRPLWWLTYEPGDLVPEVKQPDQPAPALLAIRRMSPSGEELTVLARGGEYGEWLEWLDPSSRAW